MTFVSGFWVDELEVRVFDNDTAMALAAAADAAATIRSAIDRHNRASVMFASGNSQLVFLDALIARDDVEWDRCPTCGAPVASGEDVEL